MHTGAIGRLNRHVVDEANASNACSGKNAGGPVQIPYLFQVFRVSDRNVIHALEARFQQRGRAFRLGLLW